LGKIKGKSVRRQRHMKKILALLVALAMLVTYATALEEFDYIKKYYIDPNRFAQLPGGYEIVDGQYSMIKMVSDLTPGDQQPTLSKSAYSSLTIGGDAATLTTPNAFIQQGLSTAVTGKVVSDVTKQLIYQNGEAYYGIKPYSYDPQNPVKGYDTWAGYSLDQGAVLSGDIQDCTTPSYTVNFKNLAGDEATVGTSVASTFDTILHMDLVEAGFGPQNFIKVSGPTSDVADFSLGEAYAGQRSSAEVMHFPQSELSMTDHTDLTFEAGYFAGGLADLGPGDEKLSDTGAYNKATVDFSQLDSKFSWWYTD
jgi:hypothetical protein